MDYEKAYNEAIKRAKAIIEVAEKEEEVYKSAITIFPELRESEDEQIRKEFCKDIWTFIPNEKAHKYISWLAKQGETFTKKDVDDAYLKGISDTKNELEKQDKQQPAEWSEEDDSMICELIHYLNYRNEQGDFHADLIRDWVVSLKDRTQSVKMKELLRTEYEKGRADTIAEMEKDWSEEDEVRLQACLDTLQAKSLMGKIDTVMTEWLKSLKDRYTWKPSNEQIEALEHFVRSIGESGYASPYDNNTKLLYSLLEQLKKLKA